MMIARSVRSFVVAFVLVLCFALSFATPVHGQAKGRGAPPGPPPARSAPAPPLPLTNLRRNVGPQSGRGYQEPAFARGYADGFELGRSDNKGGKRYDPVGHRDYRDADQAYYAAYGSRDAYKNNYRAGFRQGYEDGYRVK